MTRIYRNSKSGRLLKRHRLQDDLDKMRNAAQSEKSKRDIRIRQHLMERSFARATRYGFKRARWRRLWRVRIQEYLTSTVQNIMVLLAYGKERGMALSCTLPATQKRFFCSYLSFLNIRNVVFRFSEDALSSDRGYQFFAERML